MIDKNWANFLAKRLLNEYTGLTKKGGVPLNFISPVEFSFITYPFYKGFLDKKQWMQVIHKAIEIYKYQQCPC